MAEGKLTLNNWTLGMSADEYTGGSFLYSEGIRVDNTKGFKLGPRVVTNDINKRVNGYTKALVSTNFSVLAFSSDGYIESKDIFNGLYAGTTTGGGYYRRTSGGYLNAIAVGEWALGISTTKIDRIEMETGSGWGSNKITTPDLTEETGWTVGAGRTLGELGAVHTSGGGTATLETTSDLDVNLTDRVRVTIRSLLTTTGSCNITLGGINLGTISSSSDTWTLFATVADMTSKKLVLTPTSTFNGRIEYVNVSVYDSNHMKPDDITITSAAIHPVCKKGPFLYVGSGKTIDIIDTTTWTISNNVNIIDSSYSIRAITSAGNSLVVWATDGRDSKQYYWNGVDNFADEVIDWSGLKITHVTADETKAFVMVGGDTDKSRIYVVSGYQRQLLAKNFFNGQYNRYNQEEYLEEKKFNFYGSLSNSNSMCMFNDSAYITSRGGLYRYGTDIIGGNPVWSKEVITDSYGVEIPNALTTHNGILYIGYRRGEISNTNNTVGEVRQYNYTTRGYLVSNPILWDNLSTEKALTKLKIGFKNIKSTDGNIKIYAIVDDYKFRTYKVSGVTVTPGIGSIYTLITGYVTGEVIATNITDGVGTVTFKTSTISRYWSPDSVGNPAKVSGTGDDTLTKVSYSHLVHLKTIESSNDKYGNDLIFSKNFIDAHLPNRHKLQLVVELNSSLTLSTPEIFDISILSDIVDTDV